MRRAQWRSARRAAGTEFLRHVAREALRSPGAAIPWFTTLYFGPPAALGFVVNAAFGPGAGLLAVLLGLGFYPRLIKSWCDRRGPRPLDALADVLTLPLPSGTFPVVVTVRRGNAVTGLDEASAAFVDGWLVAEGARTSFSLRATDGRAEWERGTLRIVLPEFQTLTLDLVEDRGLDVYHAEVANAARRWIDRRERPEGEPVFPPLATLPFLYNGWAALGLGGFLLAVGIETLRRLTDLGPLGLLATILTLLGGLAFCRMMFVTRGQEEADRRAEALTEAAFPRQRDRPVH